MSRYISSNSQSVPKTCIENGRVCHENETYYCDEFVILPFVQILELSLLRGVVFLARQVFGGTGDFCDEHITGVF